MTSTQTTKAPRPLPWGRYRDEVDAQIAAGIAREQARGPRTRTVNGQPVYRDGGSRESYTVGYGAERTYSRPAPIDPSVLEATQPMRDLIDTLLVERQYTALTAQQIDDIKKDKAQSHRFIKFLINLPKVDAQPVVVEVPVEAPAPARRARLDFSIILDGNYAVREDGVVKFYRVTTGQNGYKNVQVRASDELHMLFGRAGIAVLHRIVEAGLAESRMLFVTELGRCCRCGRSLTDESSRADALVNGGLGPDCVGK